MIVGGDDAKRTLVTKLGKHRLGYGTTDERFGARSELVDEDEGLIVGMPHHHLHVEQMRRIGAEIVFNALLVANIYHHVLEYANLRSVAHGYR